MDRYLRIQDGVAVEAIDLPEGTIPADAFVEAIANTLRPRGIAEVGWVDRGDGQLAAPAIASEEPGSLLSYAASARFAFETAGFEFAGMRIATDRESQALITGALLRTMRGASSLRWKTAGGFVELAAEQVEAMADAVGAHVQDAFDREAEAVTGIEDGTISDRAGIDAVFA